MPKRKELVALPGIELDAFCGHEGSGTPQSLPWAESKKNLPTASAKRGELEKLVSSCLQIPSHR